MHASEVKLNETGTSETWILLLNSTGFGARTPIRDAQALKDFFTDRPIWSGATSWRSALLTLDDADRMEVSSMDIRRLPQAIGYAALVLLTGSALPGRAQDHNGHGGPARAPQKLTPQQNDLVNAAREATERFRNVTDPAQVGDPYALLFGCVSGGDFGAMGLHFVRGDVLHDGEVKSSEPEITASVRPDQRIG
jgi:hypothetical protein